MRPLLSQFSKISNAYQTVISRINTLEVRSNNLERRNEDLHKENVKLKKVVNDLTVRLKTEEAKMTISQVGSIERGNDGRICNLEENYNKLQGEITTTRALINQKLCTN